MTGGNSISIGESESESIGSQSVQRDGNSVNISISNRRRDNEEFNSASSSSDSSSGSSYRFRGRNSARGRYLHRSKRSLSGSQGSSRGNRPRRRHHRRHSRRSRSPVEAQWEKHGLARPTATITLPSPLLSPVQPFQFARDPRLDLLGVSQHDSSSSTHQQEDSEDVWVNPDLEEAPARPRTPPAYELLSYRRFIAARHPRSPTRHVWGWGPPIR